MTEKTDFEKSVAKLFRNSPIHCHGSTKRMHEQTKAAKAADDVIVALMCRLSDRSIAKMDLVEDVLNHCRFSFTAIIQRLLDDHNLEGKEVMLELLKSNSDLLKQDAEKDAEIEGLEKSNGEIWLLHEKLEDQIEQLKQQIAEETKPDDDISSGQIKSFKSADEMIDSLKKRFGVGDWLARNRTPDEST